MNTPIITFSNAQMIDIDGDETEFSIFNNTFVDNTIAKVGITIFRLNNLIEMKFKPIAADYGDYLTIFESQSIFIPAFIKAYDKLHNDETQWSIGKFSKELIDTAHKPQTYIGGTIELSIPISAKPITISVNNNTTGIDLVIDLAIAQLQKEANASYGM